MPGSLPAFCVHVAIPPCSLFQLSCATAWNHFFLLLFNSPLPSQNSQKELSSTYIWHFPPPFLLIGAVLPDLATGFQHLHSRAKWTSDLFYFDSVLLCSPRWSQTPDPPASTDQEVGLQPVPSHCFPKSTFLCSLYKGVCRPFSFQIPRFY